MLDRLLDLSSQQLADLFTSLRSGRTSWPPGALALQRFLPADEAASLAEALESVARAGVSVEAAVASIELLLAERTRRSTADSFELVWSGPEAPGSAERDTGVVVRELFGSAQESVLVVGFAVYDGQQVFKKLAERMEAVPSLDVSLFLNVHRAPGDTTKDADLLYRFALNFRKRDWPWERVPAIYYDPRSLAMGAKEKARLHAKCIVVDRRVALVSSANFTPAALERNIEVGVLVRSRSFAEQLARNFFKMAEVGLFKRVATLGTDYRGRG